MLAFPRDDEPLTQSGVRFRTGKHVHGGGVMLADGTRLCCYCDLPVRLTTRGWQPLTQARKLLTALRLRSRTEDDWLWHDLDQY